LQKHCSKLPKLNVFWRLMSGQEGIPVESASEDSKSLCGRLQNAVAEIHFEQLHNVIKG